MNIAISLFSRHKTDWLLYYLYNRQAKYHSNSNWIARFRKLHSKVISSNGIQSYNLNLGRILNCRSEYNECLTPDSFSGEIIYEE